MKFKMYALLLAQMLFSGVAFAGVCDQFIPADNWRYVSAVEQNEICYIDEADANLLDYESTGSFYSQDLDANFTTVRNGDVQALLVDADLLYTLEEGNEWAGLAWFGAKLGFSSKRTGEDDVCNVMCESYVEKSRAAEREIERLQKAEADRVAREASEKWQKEADQWSRENGVYPK